VYLPKDVKNINYKVIATNNYKQEIKCKKEGV